MFVVDCLVLWRRHLDVYLLYLLIFFYGRIPSGQTNSQKDNICNTDRQVIYYREQGKATYNSQKTIKVQKADRDLAAVSGLVDKH